MNRSTPIKSPGRTSTIQCRRTSRATSSPGSRVIIFLLRAVSSRAEPHPYQKGDAADVVERRGKIAVGVGDAVVAPVVRDKNRGNGENHSHCEQPQPEA